MRKKEFLDILKGSLAGEVSPDVIEENIKYYDNYISKSPDREQEVLDELGDPRLIARTIIETDRIAKQKNRFTGKYQEDSRQYHYENYDGNSGYSGQKGSQGGMKSSFFSNFSWYHKIMLIIILLVFLLLLLLIGRILVGLFFTLGLPILLLLVIYRMFRRR